MRVALFITCLADTLRPASGQATVDLLERLGHEVVFPPGQTCCGQMHLNAGYRADAARLAYRFLKVFGGFEAIVAPSSSCVSTVRELYRDLLPTPHDLPIYELSEFLVGRLSIEDTGASFPARVAYHPTCHSLRVTQVGEAPLRLLQAVRGLELVALDRADECCGFGGTFAVKNAAVSSAMLDDKCAALEASGADVCTALDTSCLLQIAGGLSRRRTAIRTLHLAQILAST